jgi:hypothetical protein
MATGAELTRRHESLERKERNSSNMNIWAILGGVAVVAMAVGVIVSLPDIKRYIKISTM